MRPNNSMKSLLAGHAINLADPLPHNTQYPIWCRTDEGGRSYWGVGSFWGLDRCPISPDRDLSQLEWDGNEVYLDAHTDDDVADLLKTAIGVLLFWKSELLSRYPNTSFYLIASYDNGDLLVLEEGESPVKSVTMRFWADRGEYTVIHLSDFDHWDQPAIIEHIIS